MSNRMIGEHTGDPGRRGRGHSRPTSRSVQFHGASLVVTDANSLITQAQDLINKAEALHGEL